MKIKEDILRWRAEIKKLSEQNVKVLSSAEELKADVQALKDQVSALVKITEEMTEAMLTLIGQQMGD